MKVISGRQNLEIEFGEVRKFWVKRDFFSPVFGGRESVRPEEGRGRCEVCEDKEKRSRSGVPSLSPVLVMTTAPCR